MTNSNTSNQANSVVSDTSATPQQRLFAWAFLKSKRGQTVVQHRLIAMQRAIQ